MTVMEEAVRRVGDAIPQEAVGRGWNIVRLDYDQAIADGEVFETWTADVIGPGDLSTSERRFMDGTRHHRAFTLNPFNSVPHGTLRAASLDDMVSLVKEAFGALLVLPGSEPLPSKEP